jgi:hypothetical protein
MDPRIAMEKLEKSSLTLTKECHDDEFPYPPLGETLNRRPLSHLRTAIPRPARDPKTESIDAFPTALSVPGPANDTPNQLRAATRAESDAARQLPRLTIALAEAICNCRDAVAQMPPRRFSAGQANGRASAALGS